MACGTVCMGGVNTDLDSGSSTMVNKIILKPKNTIMNKSNNKQPMLFEARYSAHIRKDGFISCSSDGRAYVIATDLEDATRKALKAFEVWKNEDKNRSKHIVESITLIDDEPIF